jgi:hypothetical protein
MMSQVHYLLKGIFISWQGRAAALQETQKEKVLKA